MVRARRTLGAAQRRGHRSVVVRNQDGAPSSSGAHVRSVTARRRRRPRRPGRPGVRDHRVGTRTRGSAGRVGPVHPGHRDVGRHDWLRIGDDVVQFRVYRGRVLECGRRIPHGPYRSSSVPDLTWVQLLTGPVNDLTWRGPCGTSSPTVTPTSTPDDRRPRRTGRRGPGSRRGLREGRLMRADHRGGRHAHVRAPPRGGPGVVRLHTAGQNGVQWRDTQSAPRPRLAKWSSPTCPDTAGRSLRRAGRSAISRTTRPGVESARWMERPFVVGCSIGGDRPSWRCAAATGSQGRVAMAAHGGTDTPGLSACGAWSASLQRHRRTEPFRTAPYFGTLAVVGSVPGAGCACRADRTYAPPGGIPRSPPATSFAGDPRRPGTLGGAACLVHRGRIDDLWADLADARRAADAIPDARYIAARRHRALPDGGARRLLRSRRLAARAGRPAGVMYEPRDPGLTAHRHCRRRNLARSWSSTVASSRAGTK
ncbi:hypothetical protein HBB16_16005 [Pseudonocardia sp. MCCB 268]|nr:hypothetical protein [Pseudonocardia cytotoxica]